MAGERRYLGISEEVAFGFATDPIAYVDFLSASLDVPSEPFVFFEGAGSRGAVSVTSGPYIASGELQFAVDPANAAHFLKWAMGLYGRQGTDSSPPNTELASAAFVGDENIVVDSESGFAVDDYVQLNLGVYGDVVQIVALDADSASPFAWATTPLIHPHAEDVEVKRVTSPFTHLFQPTKDNALPSFTVRVGKDVFEHVFTGVTIDRIAFNVERGFLTCTFGVLAQKDFKGPINASPKSFPSTLYTFRQGSTFLSSVDISNQVEAFSLEVSNNLDSQSGVRMGSRFPREFHSNGVDVSGSLTLSFEDEDEYERFWGATTGAADIDPNFFTLEQWFTQGPNRMKLILGSAFWTQIATPVSGRGRISQEVQFKTIENSVWNAVHMEATNSKVSY